MSTALTTLTDTLAARFGMGQGSQEVIDVLRNTAFKNSTQATDAQLTALMIVANQYGLNPWTKEIFAFPDRGGIVPVVGVDGWSRIINDNPLFDGMEYEQDDESCTCIIYRKDRAHPVKVTEYLSECKRGTDPWKSHPKRMLRHKATIQCARLAFGYGGIYDQDEAERIVEKEINPRSGAAVAEAAAAKQLTDEQKNKRQSFVANLEIVAKEQGQKAFRAAWRELGQDGWDLVGIPERDRIDALGKSFDESKVVEGEVV